MIKTEQKKNIGGVIALLIAALFWGSAFVAQKIVGDYPFSSNCLRFLFGAVFMVPIIIINNAIRKKHGVSVQEITKQHAKSLKGGFICGISLAFASSFQQLGLSFGASVGKSGFLTALYMVFIPLFGLFFRKKVGLNVWIAVVLALGGVFLMSYNGGFALEWGDIFTLLCAVTFAINVMSVDHFVEGTESMTFSAVQLLTAGLICAIASGVAQITGYEPFNIEIFKKIIIPILYIAIFSCCVAYTCQVIGQRTTEPAIASIFMCLESVFALLFSVTLGGPLGKLLKIEGLEEQLSLTMILGVVLIFMAVLLAQFDIFTIIKEKRKKIKEQK